MAGTAIEVQQKAQLAFGTGGVKLVDIDQIWRFSTAIHNAGFACKGDTVDSIVIKIAMGMELGIAPLMAVQNIAVINGRPSIWGDIVPGLVEASGLLVFKREWYEGTGDNFAAYCEVQRKGRERHCVPFSIEDAKRAKLWGKQGAWTDHPKRMLMWRSRSFAYRDEFPDVIKGIAIAEEQRDAIDVTDSVPAGPPRRQKPASTRAMETAAAVAEEVAVNEDGEIIDADAEVLDESPFTPIDADERMRVFKMGQEAAARLGKTIINVEEFNECFGIDYDNDPIDRIESSIANWSPNGAPKKESPLVAPKPEPVADPMGTKEDRAELLAKIKELRSELGMGTPAVIQFCLSTPELGKGPNDLTLAQLGRVVELLTEAKNEKGDA